MNKIILLAVSFIVFISLTIVSFNYSDNKDDKVATKTDPDSSTEVTTPKTVQPNTNKVTTPIPGDYVVEDFKAEVSRNEVVLTWTNPTMKDIQNFKLIRTSSKPEGESTTYNVGSSKGRFVDKNLKPGIRYYYELSGKISSGILYSGLTVAEIAGNITISANDSFLTINGEKKQFEPSIAVKSFISNGKIMLPLKSVAEVLGGTVYWVTETNKSKSNGAVLKFRKTEIELTVGKKTMVVNRKAKEIDIAPIVKNGVLYAPYSIIGNYMACNVKWSNGVLKIEKPVEEAGEYSAEKVYPFDLTVMEGEEFDITLVDSVSDGKKWYYTLNKPDALTLKSRKYQDQKDGNSKYTMTFKPTKSGDNKIIIRYFNPRLGEATSEQTFIYTLKITPKQ